MICVWYETFSNVALVTQADHLFCLSVLNYCQAFKKHILIKKYNHYRHPIFIIGIQSVN